MLLVALLHQVVGLLLQGGGAFVAAVFDHHPEAAGGRPGRGRAAGRNTIDHAPLRPPREPCAGVRRRSRWRCRSACGAPRTDRATTNIVPKCEPLAPSTNDMPRDADRVGDPLVVADDLVGVGHRLFGPLQRGRIGKLDRRQEIALVLVGNEAGRHPAEAPTGQVKQPAVDHQHQQAHAQQFSDRPQVSADGEGKCLVEEPEEPAEQEVETPARAGRGARAAGLSKMAHRAGLRVSELNAERTVETAIVKANWRKNRPVIPVMNTQGTNTRGQHQADGDHRRRDLGHRLMGGGARRHPLFDMVFRGLDHHDGVVNDDADGQHQAEQRKRVEAEPHQRHGGESADDGHRHGDQGDQRRTPVLQEHQHHHGHQQHGVAESVENLVDRLADVGRGVVVDVVLDPLGKSLAKLLHLGLHALGRVQGVGAGQLEDADADGRLAVDDIRRCPGSWPPASPAPRRPAARPARPPPVLTMMSANCSGSMRRPRVVMVYWKSMPLAAGGWPTWPAATCTFCSRSDLTTSPAVNSRDGQQVGIEPDAHAVIALAEDHRVADPFQPRQSRPGPGSGRSCSDKARRTARRARPD